MNMTSAHIESKLDSKDIDFLIQEAKDYAFSTGLIMRVAGSDDATFAPICLFPSPFPREWFLKAQNVQTSLNLLMHRVSVDTNFLQKCLQKTAQTDDFIRNLLEIYDSVLAEGYAQNFTLGLLRMDYMLDTEGESVVGMKQVEMNTISASFAALSSLIHPLHAHILKHIDCPDINYPESQVLEEFAKGFASAWKVYGKLSSIIVFVVNTGENNIADQRLLEYAIYAVEPRIKVKRYTLDEIHALGYLKNRSLFVGTDEVSVVYYRTGYTPDQFPNSEAWATRLMLERSKAIQCPNVPIQLAGMKKVQQELTREGVLEKFLPDILPEILQLIKTLFAGQYSLDLDEEGDKATAMAIATPERYVMKPQREGGGNNLYGVEVSEALQSLPGPEREAYVLMELISPPVQPNYIIRRNRSVNKIDTVGELGIYGVFLGDGDNVLVNSVAGHLLRCKGHGMNEGGVNMGYGAINLPYLV